MIQKTITFLLLCMISLCVSAQGDATVKHEVMSGETLYSISRTYGVKVDELKRLNPTLDPDRVMAGQRINVPAAAAAKVKSGNNNQPQSQTQPQNQTQVQSQSQIQTQQISPTVQQPQQQPRPKYKATHEVQKKETIYSISRMYGITEDEFRAANPEVKKDKLKKGSIVNIPFSEAENRAYEAEQLRQQKAREEAEAREKQKAAQFKNLRVAVILPFSLSAPSMSVDAQKMANLYQGFLLAVDTLKHQGYSVDVMAVDESSENVNVLLEKESMKNCQLIIGPMNENNLSAVANFAKANGITHVLPQTKHQWIVDNHPTTYVVNVQNSALQSMVGSRFLSLHRADNVIFVNTQGNVNGAYAEMRKALDGAGVAYSTLEISEISKIKEMVKTDKVNVIVPSSGATSAFSTLCSRLNGIRFDEGTRIQLFGYPEWQTMEAKQHNNLVKYNSQFYTSFFHNGHSANTQSFERQFLHWFKQVQHNSYPRWGELGFDIGMYFLKGLKLYGSEFANNVTSFSQRSLEFPLNFERKGEGTGWQNKSIMVVTYGTDGTVSVR